MVPGGGASLSVQPHQCGPGRGGMVWITEKKSLPKRKKLSEEGEDWIHEEEQERERTGTTKEEKLIWCTY